MGTLQQANWSGLVRKLRVLGLSPDFATFALWAGHLCPLHPSFAFSKIEMDQKTSRLPSMPNIKEMSKTVQCVVRAGRLNHGHVGAEDHRECPQNSTLSMLSPITARVCHLRSLNWSLLL